MILFSGQEGSPRHKEQTVNTVREGEGGTNENSSMKTCTLSCVKQIPCGSLLCDTGKSTQCSLTA